MTETTKFCVDCNWHRVGETHVCAIYPLTDRVTGLPVYHDCYNRRSYNSPVCGDQGRLWEPKQGD